MYQIRNVLLYKTYACTHMYIITHTHHGHTIIIYLRTIVSYLFCLSYYDTPPLHYLYNPYGNWCCSLHSSNYIHCIMMSHYGNYIMCSQCLNQYLKLVSHLLEIVTSLQIVNDSHWKCTVNLSYQIGFCSATHRNGSENVGLWQIIILSSDM